MQPSFVIHTPEGSVSNVLKWMEGIMCIYYYFVISPICFVYFYGEPKGEKKKKKKKLENKTVSQYSLEDSMK